MKRSQAPKSWPIPRKSKKKRYVAINRHSKQKAISLLFLLRDVLKIAGTRKEVKYIVSKGYVKVNNKIRKDEKFPLQVLDVLQLEKSGKNYRLEIVNKKFNLNEISDKEADRKIVKIIGIKTFKKGKIQMNLEDGQNFITKQKFSIGDSAIVNTKEKNIEKILPLKKSSKIEIISGKHAGEKGTIEEIEDIERGKRYVIKLGSGEKVALPFKTILVIG